MNHDDQNHQQKHDSSLPFYFYFRFLTGIVTGYFFYLSANEMDIKNK